MQSYWWFYKCPRIGCLPAEALAKPKEKVPERRLWLTGSIQSSPGLIGLFNTACVEPLGDRLRLLFCGDPNLQSAQGVPDNPKGD